MSPIDLSRLMQPFAANLVHERSIRIGQMQFSLAHENTSKHQVVMTGLHSCSVISVSMY